VACLVVYTMSFCSSWNSIPWIYPTEVFPNKLRGRASTICTIVNFCASFVVTFTFLPIQKYITHAGLFWTYCGVTIFATIGAYFVLPETKNKTIEEIQETL